MFLFVDNFDPEVGNASKLQARSRVNQWLRYYPKLAKNHRDADDRAPQHTWFYPCGRDISFLSTLSELPFRGLGEIELHLHHDRDDSESLYRKIEAVKHNFLKRGACITAEQTPRQYYGIIHGNWALDNSRPDGKFCRVNDEFTVLKNTRCYADFTMPSAPHPTQTRKVNSIYYAKDNPRKPKSHNKGIDAKVGFRNRTDFLLVQGPLGICWNDHHKRWNPDIENGEISSDKPPTKKRVDRWIKSNIHVKGRPNWIFVKVYAQGAPDNQHAVLLGKPLHEMFTYLETQFNDGKNYQLHYVTAREAYNIIKAAEDGKDGNPGNYRDYIIPPYVNTRIRANVLYELKSYSKDKLEIFNLQKDRYSRFTIKKGQLEKIEGIISSLKFRRYYQKRILVLNVVGKNQINLSVRTERPIRRVDGGRIIKIKRMNRYHISHIRSELRSGINNQIVIKW